MAQAAYATRLDDRSDRPIARLLRPAILLFVAALHAALLLVAARWQTRIELRSEESLIFLPLPSHMQGAEEDAAPPPEQSHKAPAPSHDTQLVTVPPPLPAPSEPPPPEQPPAKIDWNAEAALTAKRQAESAAAPGPRALDKHGAGMDLDGGLGPDLSIAPEFGWDHAHTHRVEALEGGGSLLWINDRCFIVMAGLIPFPMCGVGKIPVRGDLFDHMRDLPAQEPNANNTAP
ncbi:MAG TPA: hypothetical protein VHS76_04960 [Steroidobacteraceae bacterium]|jgi:hypothetical protein|nr:hypothetical protein [Steroidobacteraceae bacterium]